MWFQPLEELLSNCWIISDHPILITIDWIVRGQTRTGTFDESDESFAFF